MSAAADAFETYRSAMHADFRDWLIGQIRAAYLPTVVQIVDAKDELRGFLHAMRSNPFDRLSRLAFADWLQDRGDPWSVSYAALVADVDGHRAWVYSGHSVLADTRPVPTLLADGIAGVSLLTAGGFVCGVRGGITDILRTLRGLCAEHPITVVDVTDHPPGSIRVRGPYGRSGHGYASGEPYGYGDTRFVPARVFHPYLKDGRLRGERDTDRAGRHVVTFDTAAAAGAALNHALLAYGRKEAGYDPWTVFDHVAHVGTIG